MARSRWFSPEYPEQRRRVVPADAFTTGDQPPPFGRQLATMLAIVALAWPQENAALEPGQRSARIAPLVAASDTQVDNPPIRGTFRESQATERYWSWRTRPIEQDGHRGGGGSATEPGTGDTPLTYTTVPTQVLEAWEPPFQLPPRLKSVSAAWDVTIAVTNDPPPRARRPDLILAIWEDQDVYVQLPDQGSIPQPVDDPPLRGALAPQLSRILAAWEPPFISPPPLAASTEWDFPAAVVNDPPPRALAPRQVLTAWEFAAEYRPSVTRPSAILALTYGDAPPLVGPSPLGQRLPLIAIAWEPPYVAPPPLALSAEWDVPRVDDPPLLARSVPWYVRAQWADLDMSPWRAMQSYRWSIGAIDPTRYVIIGRIRAFNNRIVSWSPGARVIITVPEVADDG